MIKNSMQVFLSHLLIRCEKVNMILKKTEAALPKTINITAYDGEMLVGRLRMLTDGYFFVCSHRFGHSALENVRLQYGVQDKDI